MPKTKKNKKIIKAKTKNIKKPPVKEEVKKIDCEEETEKEGGALSDGVLDAFDELTPSDILLLEEETLLAEEDEEDELDSGDYKANDEW